MFLFFSVARSAHNGQAERAKPAQTASNRKNGGSKADMPTDKLVDVTADALRMSSPFNSGYWLSAA